MIELVATTSGWHHDGWSWLWPLVPLAWLLVFFVLARTLLGRAGRGPWAASTPDPRAILAERYARGEISHDEYRERLAHLEER
jgi:putative membrane protein